jgi:hypothetical protein
VLAYVALQGEHSDDEVVAGGGHVCRG